MALEFLTLDEVLDIHADQIARYGGSLGVRDVRLLESALAQPQTSFGGQYLHADLAAMAAAYLFHLVKNHPFIDGNKRVGAAAASVFLLTNGQCLVCTNDELVATVLAVATSEMDKAALTIWLRAECQPMA